MIHQTNPTMLVTLFVAVMLQLMSSVASQTHHYHDYIIVGAGPSGLQMGYYLKSANRDYLIMERGNVSGKFLLFVSVMF